MWHSGADIVPLYVMVWQQQPSKEVVGAAQLLEAAKGLCCPAAQEAVLQVLYSPLCQAAPPTPSYIARLVKQLITAAEEQRQELSEALLNLHTALLLQGTDRNAQQGSAAWRYKTYYYSKTPSWQELQRVQQQHCRQLLAGAKRDAGRSSVQQAAAAAAGAPTATQQQQELRGSWQLPVHLQQQLLRAQQAMQELLAACGWQQQQQQQDMSECVSCSLAATADRSAASGAQQHAQQVPGSLSLISVQPAHYASTCSSSSSGSRGVHEPDIHCADRGLITVYSSDNMFEGGTGCHMWDAGFLLAEFVLNNTHVFSGRRVLEVGCGPGLVATCLCRSGAGRVLLTDGDPQTLVNCLSNLRLNGHTDAALLGSWQQAAGFVLGASCTSGNQHQVLACPLDWHEDVPGLTADVIVGSDICYDPEAVPSLVRLLQQLLPEPTTTATCERVEAAVAAPAAAAAPAAEAAHISAGSGSNCGAGAAGDVTCPQMTGPVAFISTTKRQDSTLQLFLTLCAAAGLEVVELPKDPLACVTPGQLQALPVCGVTATSNRNSNSSSSLHGDGVCADSGAVVAQGSGVQQTVVQPVRLQQLPALRGEAAREGYVLHRVSRQSR